MKMNAKDILTPTVSLFIICLVATLLLAVVNNVTYAKIQEQTAKAEAEARVAVLPDAKDFKEVKKGGNVDYYEGVDTNGETVGYVFNTVGESKGYGGAVSVTVGITADEKSPVSFRATFQTKPRVSVRMPERQNGRLSLSVNPACFRL